MVPRVIFEDDSLLVIDKPSGLVVNRADSVKEITIQDWIEETYGKFEGDSDFAKRNGIAHRIDKETSGILLASKTEESFIELLRQFKEREVTKTYLALVHGEVKSQTGTIDAPVGRLPWNRERFGVLAGGREATTGYKVTQLFNKTSDLKKGPKEIYSLVEFYPKTGRTHQIRVHAKYIHHPLVGDTFYAGRKTSRNDRSWCPRLFLHAAKIEFTHPETKQRVQFESKLPQDLKNALEKLKEV